MRKSFVTLAVGLIIILMSSCSSGKKTNSTEDDSDTLCTCPPESFVHIDLQPLGDFTQKEANQLKKELEKHLVDNGKTMKIMMDGVRTRNRIIAALIVLLFLVAMYALYLDFHCVQIGFWRG